MAARWVRRRGFACELDAPAMLLGMKADVVLDIDRYQRAGFLVVPRFLDGSTCEEMIARARALVDAFEPTSTVSIFTTNEQTRTSDEYFLESGNDVRFFFEEEAFLPDGTLRQGKSIGLHRW
jgi:phytanoyl-CoA hydroxylase